MRLLTFVELPRLVLAIPRVPSRDRRAGGRISVVVEIKVLVSVRDEDAIGCQVSAIEIDTNKTTEDRSGIPGCGAEALG